MAVRSCWILAGTGTCCRIRWSRASQTCSMGDMSGEYAGHARTGMFSASWNCVQILSTWGRALSCCNMSWWSLMNGTTMGSQDLRISETQDSFVKRTPLLSARRHRMWAFAHSVTTINCSQVETPMRTTSMQMSFPEMVSDSLWRNSLVMQTDCCSSCLGGEDAGCGSTGLVWLYVVCGCEAGWMYCQILWNTFGDGLW